MINVIQAGHLNTVQDMGRSGLRHLGICQAGALDRNALAIANLLVGNPCDAAAIEFTLGPCQLHFASATRIALAGADFGASVDGRRLSPWWSVAVQAGQTLKLVGAQHSMRTYLAVAGGIASALQLGARATDLQAGFGGHAGRALIKNDRLSIGTPNQPQLLTAASFGVRPPDWYHLNEHINTAASSDTALPIRVMCGPEYPLFNATSQQAFWNQRWHLSAHSNRMGLHLVGPALTLESPTELRSQGVLPGVIQVPPAGQPIVLMADAQTTGGYPKIGVVIEADLAKLAQLRPNRTLRFVACEAREARLALQQEADYRQQLETAIALQTVRT